MRVLHFFKSYWPDTFGGIERTIHAIARGTARHGIETEVLSLSRDPEANERPFDGHVARKARLDLEFASTGFSIQAFGRFRALGKSADLIHYHYPWPFMDLVHFTSHLGKPTVVTYHSDVVKQRTLMHLYRPLMRRFLADVDAIVATSPNYVATSEDLIPFHDKIEIIPIGLDAAAYPEPEPARLARWKTVFPGPFFLFVGVLRYYKGLDVLIDAARGLEFPLVVVGEGPMGAELRQRAERAGATNVHFLGAVEDVDKMALLQLSRALVFPSRLRSEAFGLSLVEASMRARPMITCEIGTGTSYVNRNGETGLIVPPNDPQALAAAMSQLYRDPALAEQLGSAAHQRYLSLFTADGMTDAYAALYRRLVHGDPPAPAVPHDQSPISSR